MGGNGRCEPFHQFRLILHGGSLSNLELSDFSLSYYCSNVQGAERNPFKLKVEHCLVHSVNTTDSLFAPPLKLPP